MPLDTNPLLAFPFYLLWLAIVFVLLKQSKPAMLFVAASLAFALYAEIINLTALAPLVALLMSVLLASAFSRRSNNNYFVQRIVSHIAPFPIEKHLFRVLLFRVLLCIVILISLVLGFHVFDGFNHPLIIKDIRLAENTLPYTLYWRYDTAFVAFSLYYLYKSIAQRSTIVLSNFMLSLLVALLTVIAVHLCALLFGLIAWNPKLPNFFLYWALSNLLITSIAEEGFFRGVIQYQLGRLLKLKTKYGNVIALAVTAVLFGLAHAAMGEHYVIVATIAGLGYGLVFQLTGRLEASIISHFLLNAVHLLLFSYPMIAISIPE